MPYKITRLKNGKFRVTGPNGRVFAKATTLKKAKAQIRLLYGLEFVRSYDKKLYTSMKRSLIVLS
jgi:hypothetical protein